MRMGLNYKEFKTAQEKWDEKLRKRQRKKIKESTREIKKIAFFIKNFYCYFCKIYYFK